MVGRRRSSHPPASRSRRRAPWRGVGLAAALASTVALAWPGEAAAAPRDDRPWGRGVLRPTFGLSPWGLFNQDVASLSFGLGFNYFIVNGLSLGLGVSDTIFIYRSAYKARYPGIDTQLPTNMLEVTPTLQYVFFRSRRFSPYVYGGVGPVFFNHGAGTHGQWVGGPGVYINVTGPLYVSLGVGFSGLFPGGRCNEALTYQPEDPLGQGVLLDLCSFRWGPQVGMVVAFGGGGASRERRREREREPAPPPTPASNPLDEAVPPTPEAPSEADPPIEDTAPAPEPDPTAAPPAPEGDPPIDAPPADTEPRDPAIPPEAAEPEPSAPIAEPGPTDVPLPPQPGKIAPPR